MKICVGSAFPGGTDAEILFPFEDSELFDYYNVTEAGAYELIAQTRRCLCSDLVEPVVRRGIDAVIVQELSSASLLKFTNAGVRVFITKEKSVRTALDRFRDGDLQELTMKDFARLPRKHQ